MSVFFIKSDNNSHKGLKFRRAETCQVTNSDNAAPVTSRHCLVDRLVSSRVFQTSRRWYHLNYQDYALKARCIGWHACPTHTYIALQCTIGRYTAKEQPSPNIAMFLMPRNEDQDSQKQD